VSTAATIDLIQALNRTVTGLAQNGAPALADYPTVLDDAALPLCLTWPADGESYSKGGGAKQERRTYRVIVFIEFAGLNDIPTNAQAAVALHQRFKDLYITVANIPLATPPPYQVTIETAPDGAHVSDGGIVPSLSFSGKPYIGFEFRVPVREYWL
jgi:hypothetical protein